MRKLLVQDFIEQHQDWEKLLSEKPYCLQVSKDTFNGQRLVMLKYSMVDSDFSNPIVCECRGLILDEDTLELVSVPFFKFFNFGEAHAASIDWQTARIGEKVDGSLVKIVNVGDNLLVSTNGTILAENAPVAEQIGCKYKSFSDIVNEVLTDVLDQPEVQALMQKHGYGAVFQEGFTYMFELVSPWTKVVVPYQKNDLYFLGKRDNTTLEETYFTDDPMMSKLFKTPKVFKLRSIDDCVDAAKALPWDEEGYVVCDGKFNRVKVKSPQYLAAHRLKGNGVLSYARALELARANEIDEVAAYFPEFKPALDECKARFWKLVDETEQAWKYYLTIDKSLASRKDKALWITSNFKMPGIAFAMLDGKLSSIRDYFMECPTEKLLKHLGYKE